MKLQFQLPTALGPGSQGRTSKENLPLFLSSTGVSGLVTVEAGSVPVLQASDLVIVNLRGHFRTSVSYSEAILNLTRTLRPNRASARTSASPDVVSLGFDFALHAFQKVDYDVLLGHRLPKVLPSSLDISTSWRADIHNSEPWTTGLVSYELRAHLIRNGFVQASAIQKIAIYHSIETMPPIYTHGLKPEYSINHPDVNLRSRLFTKLGTLSIAAAQPSPFMFCQSREQVAAKLLLRLIFKPSGSTIKSSPSPLLVAAAWQLRSSTFVTMLNDNSLPVIRGHPSSPFHGVVSSLEPSQRLKMEWSNWQKSSDSQYPAAEQDAWTMEQELWLSMPSSYFPPPTFSTRHISRKYAISLRLALRGIGRAETKFEVPVQIAYRSPVSADIGSLQDVPRSDARLSGRTASDAISVMSVELPLYKA